MNTQYSNNINYNQVQTIYEQPQYYTSQPQVEPFHIQLEKYPQQHPSYPQPQIIAKVEVLDYQDDNCASLTLLILGFFFGFPWLIGAILYLKSKSETARSYAKISLILFIISIGIVIVFFVIAFISIAVTGAAFGSIVINSSKNFNH
ncbi:hypothetical protein ACTFIV_002634 [Dictyostelium citrinum]